ncbi:MAG: hypothetical protein V1905_00370 [bacterium]
MEDIISLKNFGENIQEYAEKVKNGRSTPLFKISPLKEDRWEEVIDFTKITKGGIDINDLLSRI